MSNETRMNALGQPIGAPVAFSGAQAPDGKVMRGQYCRLEQFDFERHTVDLYEAYKLDKTGGNWTYLPVDAFEHLSDFQDWIRKTCTGKDPFFYSVIDLESGQAIGLASYLRISPAVGSIEVGWINFSPRLQRTPAATETMYLMMREAFSLGYRRYEWKCDNLNAPSHAAAKRLGFTFEGVFRQALVNKGRNRDTAWFSVIDSEWPTLETAFETWLSPDNFDGDGQQKVSLAKLRE